MNVLVLLFHLINQKYIMIVGKIGKLKNEIKMETFVNKYKK